MKIQYLGTAAAEGAPAMYCHCKNCEAFRKAGGKNLRARSQALIDDELLIDFNADTYLNFQRFGLDLSAVKNIVITHSHHDHFVPFDLLERKSYKAEGMREPMLALYGNRVVLNKYQRFIDEDPEDEKNVSLYELKPFEKVKISDYEITPLSAQHMPSEDAYIFLIEKDGKSILYCNDTGLLPKESMVYLKQKGIKLDFIGFDCTFGIAKLEYSGHMGIDTNISQLEMFKQAGFLKTATQVVITHFSHWNLLLHSEMEEIVEKYGFKVAYDGVCYEI